MSRLYFNFEGCFDYCFEELFDREASCRPASLASTGSSSPSQSVTAPASTAQASEGHKGISQRPRLVLSSPLTGLAFWLC
jgi:hypothetical protein